MQAGELRTPENAAIILERLEAGDSVCSIAANIIGCEESNIRKWARDDPAFGTEYARARALGYERLADEILEIADESGFDAKISEGGIVVDGEAIARARLRVDTRKWMLSKMLPKVFGEKQEIKIDLATEETTRKMLAECKARGMAEDEAVAFVSAVLGG